LKSKRGAAGGETEPQTVETLLRAEKSLEVEEHRLRSRSSDWRVSGEPTARGKVPLDEGGTAARREKPLNGEPWKWLRDGTSP